MTRDYALLLKKLENTVPTENNEENLRQLIFEMLNMCPVNEREDFLKLARQKLRKLQNGKIKNKQETVFKSCNLGALLESVSRSVDILLSDVDMSLDFSFESCECDVAVNFIIDAFLNLISNSAKFSSGKAIYAYTKTVSNTQIIVVENSGSCPCGNFNGQGIKSAADIAKFHGGRLFYSSSKNTVKASMSFPCVHKSKRKYNSPLFFDYLIDDFSPVQVGLSDVWNEIK